MVSGLISVRLVVGKSPDGLLLLLLQRSQLCKTALDPRQHG